MISLHVTLYTADDEGDRFKVTTIDPNSGEPQDITDEYDVVSIETDDGQQGFAVLKLEPAGVEA